MPLLLAQQIARMFLMLLCGYAAVRAGLLKSEDSRVLSILTIYVVCPASILNAFQIEYTPEIARNFMLALGSGVLIHALLFALVYGMHFAFRFSGIEKASLIYSNAGNLILPLVPAILGEEWLIYASAFILVQNVFLWSHGKSVIEGKKGMDLKALLTNVNLIACAAGIVMLVLRLRFPPILRGAVQSLGGMVGPATMLTLGMIFAGIDLKSMLRGKRLWGIALLKMIVIPGIVILVMKHAGLRSVTRDGRTVLYISLLACMTPTAASVTQIARLYDREPGYAAAINTVTTLLCLATMPLMTMLYEL